METILVSIAMVITSVLFWWSIEDLVIEYFERKDA